MKKALQARRLLARKVRLLRFMRGWSQADLASVSGLHRTYISAVERGKCNISLDNVERLARAFSLSLHELFFFSEDFGTPSSEFTPKSHR